MARLSLFRGGRLGLVNVEFALRQSLAKAADRVVGNLAVAELKFFESGQVFQILGGRIGDFEICEPKLFELL